MQAIDFWWDQPSWLLKDKERWETLGGEDQLFTTGRGLRSGSRMQAINSKRSTDWQQQQWEDGGWRGSIIGKAWIA
jgi:hypothetical protein